MEQIDNLKELINQGDVDTAIKQLDQLLQDSSVEKEKDTLYYLREMPTEERRLEAGTGQLPVCHRDQSGQSCRSGGKMVIDILNFYHKDMFNQ